MITRILHRLALFGLIALILASVITAVAAANTVPPSRLTDQSRPITANDLKPPECAALNLREIVVGSGDIKGTGKNELILGSSGPDTIRSLPGDDCILGGGGDDHLSGDKDTDVCIGGPGNDTFDDSCETQIQ